MRLKLLAMLLIAAVLLTACGYVVVEDAEPVTVGSLFGLSALAEEESRPAPTRVILPATIGEAEAASEPTPLSNGSRGEDVKTLQTLLKEYGFLNGNADGIYGKKTEAAVREVQEYQYALEQEEAARVRAEVFDYIREAEKRFAFRRSALTPDTQTAEENTAAGFTLMNITPRVMTVRGEKEFRATGEADQALIRFLQDDFQVYRGDLSRGAGGEEVRRLQTRLNNMYYLYGGIDGRYGSNTALAVKYFQRLNGLEETGIADEETQKMLFSPECRLSDYPMYQYRVEISISKQRVYVYKWHYGAYSELVKTMKCTTGAVETPTPLGTFKMGGPCGRWYYFSKFECWAQYASRINGGILFHSVIYSEKDESTLRQSSLTGLGKRGSHGCVRLTVEDAKWIYKNIPAGTTCRVYN